ncbi:hypothetical protein [Streptomyces misionensis]|uniref:hypothetical protein n=1 Tax=Streptomyces misionensis TaxID=67331 RepID=UPI0034111FC7
MSTTPRLDSLAAGGTNGAFERIRLADGHTLTLKTQAGSATAEEVFLFGGLDAPDTEAWADQDDWEAWLTGGSLDDGPLYLEVPVQAVRELIEQHGGEHADQDRRTYRVTILRTERIEFAVEADSREDAEARYLMDGVEVASETDSTSIESVTLDQE